MLEQAPPLILQAGSPCRLSTHIVPCLFLLSLPSPLLSLEKHMELSECLYSAQ